MKKLDSLLSQARDNASQVQAEVQDKVHAVQQTRDGNLPPNPPRAVLAPQQAVQSQPAAFDDSTLLDQSAAVLPPVSSTLPAVQSEPTAFDASTLDQSAVDTKDAVEPAPGTPKGVAPPGQSEDAVSDPKDDGEPAPGTPKEGALPGQSHVADPVPKETVSPVLQPAEGQVELNPTGARQKLPVGLQLTKSQRKRE